MAIHSVKGSIGFFLVLCVLWIRSKSLIGLFYLPSLVYVYNATPHSTTGFQPYELMFGHKAPMPCDNWLGLGQYETGGLKSKSAWLSQQLDALVATNKQALKSIHKTMQHSKAHAGRKSLTIPVGNYVLLRDYPDGWNKIQDRYKPDIYVVVAHHQEPNVYYIQLLNSDCKGHPKVVNRHQLYDLNQSCLLSESSTYGSGDGDVLVIPSFLSRNSKGSNILNFTEPPVQHHYNTRSKPKGAANVQSAAVEIQVIYL